MLYGDGEVEWGNEKLALDPALALPLRQNSAPEPLLGFQSSPIRSGEVRARAGHAHSDADSCGLREYDERRRLWTIGRRG